MKWITRILVGLAVVLVALRVADWGVRRSSKLPITPPANGYQRLVELGASAPKPAVDLAEMKRDEILAAAARNAGLIKEARTLLNGPVQVPLSTRNAWVSEHQTDLKSLKKLAVALSLEGRANWLAGRTNEAVDCGVDVVRLGQSISRGGLLVDGLTGLTLELVGVAVLRAQAGQLPAAMCRHTARTLADADRHRESAGAILRNQTVWADATFGLISRVGSLFSRRANADRYRDYRSRDEDTVRRTRRLSLLLAARAMELETGRRPQRPAELVPGYLPAVPLDPGTGKPVTDVPTLGN